MSFNLNSSEYPLRQSGGWGRRQLVGYFIFGAVLAVIFAFIQSGTVGLAGYDGYFHIKYSMLLGQEGFIDRLPWLHYTIRRDSFRDHHLLWHYLLIPFTRGDLIQGGQLAVQLFFLGVGLAFYHLLSRAGVRLAGLWSLAALLSSHAFLYRMSMLRVQSVALTLLLLCCCFCMQRRYLLLTLLSTLFVWLYDGFPLLLLITGVFCLSGWLLEQRADIKLVLACLLGIALGMVLNPYFPENISSLVYNASRSLFLDVPGMHLGNEWRPYSTWGLVGNAVPVFVIFFLTVLGLVFIKRLAPEEFSALLLNIFFLILTFKSRRFIEYWPLFAFLSGALILGRRMSTWAVIISFLLISPFLTHNVKKAYSDLEGEGGHHNYRGASLWLKENSAAGEIVFNADWDDFPFLFFWNHQNYYIVGMDPMYLYTYDPKKSDLYKAITKGHKEAPARLVREEFNSRFIYLDRGHGRLLDRLEEDPLADKVYEDEAGYIFQVVEAPETQSDLIIE